MYARILDLSFCMGAMVVALSSAMPARAGEVPNAPVLEETRDGRITVNGLVFDSWNAYANSDFFRENGLRCATKPSGTDVLPRGGGPADCTFTLTNPDPIYDPSVTQYRIPVVVHVIRHSNGTTGHISEAMVESQIDILNEDLLALPGTNGENGTDIQIDFYLAAEDPAGNPTNGITYSDNTTWYNDDGAYWNSLAWDTNRYLNIYTNTASGALGYVPDLPQGGIVGSNADRVVILWSAFGLNAPIGPPYNKGRTVTHEVGHYFGLNHTFSGGCAGPAGCYTNGDLICDTNPESSPTFGCSNSSTCGSLDPIHNYMDYSDDLCMEEFTTDQALRMRCTLEHYRPDLFDAESGPVCGNGIVEEGESCDTAILPGNPGTCPVDCDTGDPCIVGTLLDGGTCSARCEFETITAPSNGDGCCPPEANAVNDNDCQPVCGNGACEPGEVVGCVTDCECAGDAECDDRFACTADRCVGGMCSYQSNTYGDVNQDGAVDLFDLFCILNGFAGDFSVCSFSDDDLEPCAGNDSIDLFDLFAVLNAFAGVDPCCGNLP